MYFPIPGQHNKRDAQKTRPGKNPKRDPQRPHYSITLQPTLVARRPPASHHYGSYDTASSQTRQRAPSILQVGPDPTGGKQEK